MSKKKRQSRRTQQRRVQQLVHQVPRPWDDPNLCPACGKIFALVVGCHKVCRCGYAEGCGD